MLSHFRKFILAPLLLVCGAQCTGKTFFGNVGSSEDILFTQTSAVAPQQIAAKGGYPFTYNFTQQVAVSYTMTLPKYASLRCAVSLSESEPADPDAASTLCGEISPVTDGQVRRYKAAVVSQNGTLLSKPVVSYPYRVDFSAYNSRLKITLATGTNTSSADALTQVEYTPVCGESFEISRAAAVNSVATTDSALINTAPYGIPAPTTIADGAVATPLAATATAVSIPLDTITGRDYAGGRATRLKVSIRFIGGSPSPYFAEEVFTVIYPKLSLTALDMHARPKITPYLHTRQEPVVRISAQQTDFFTGAATPATAATTAFFRLQYAAQHKPYGPSANTISWSGTLVDPDFSEGTALQATFSAPLAIIDTEPFTTGSKHSGNSGSTFKKNIPAENGVAFFQIPNPYDAAKIGEAAHLNYVGATSINGNQLYDGIDNSLQRGELYSKAFRTAVRFRVRARGAGFRDAAEVLRSFESNTVSNFDTFISASGNEMDAQLATAAHLRTNRRFAHGTTQFTSDMPAAYRSYPIEVCERYEGWGTKNHRSNEGSGGVLSKWYQKHGITWYGGGQGSNGETNQKNEAADSLNKNFDPTRKKILLISHGWQPAGMYDVLVRRPFKFGSGGLYDLSQAFSSASDYAAFNAAYAGLEYEVEQWVSKGYNVGFFHWHKYAQEKNNIVGAPVPGGSEVKIYYPTSTNRMNFYPESLASAADGTGNNANAMADCVRSASIGQMAAQDFIDAMPPGYTPELIAFAGHSLGNQVVTNAAEKLIRAYSEGAIDVSLVPDRVDLLDPYFGNNSWTDNDYPTGNSLLNSTRKQWLAGENSRVYADRINAFAGDDVDGAGLADSAGIPMQWFRTTALTQPILGLANDNNSGLFTKTNYVKHILGTNDGGYVPQALILGYMSGDLHNEVIRWYLSSVNRSDAGSQPSAAADVGFLYNRLNAGGFRDGAGWTFCAQNATGRGTLTATDDTFSCNQASGMEF